MPPYPAVPNISAGTLASRPATAPNGSQWFASDTGLLYIFTGGTWQEVAANVVATTGIAGFALQNATPTILTWAVPNDGRLHTVLTHGVKVVTSLETGGAVIITYTPSGSGSQSNTLIAGGQAVSNGILFTVASVVAQPNTTVTVSQQTNLTAGASSIYASILAD